MVNLTVKIPDKTDCGCYKYMLILDIRMPTKWVIINLTGEKKYKQKNRKIVRARNKLAAIAVRY